MPAKATFADRSDLRLKNTVTVPTLPGCVTFGETVDEAIAMASRAIEVYLEDLQETGEEIPTGEGLLEYTLTVEAHA